MRKSEDVWNMSDTVYTIRQLKERLIPIFINNRIKRAVLFGSYGKDSGSMYIQFEPIR